MNACADTPAHAYMHILVHVCACVCANDTTCVYMHGRVYTQTYIHTRTYVRTYIYTYTRIHAYTFLHTCIQFALVRMHTYKEEHAKAESLLDEDASIKSLPAYLLERAFLKENYYIHCLNTFMDLGTLVSALDQACGACEAAVKVATVSV